MITLNLGPASTTYIECGSADGFLLRKDFSQGQEKCDQHRGRQQTIATEWESAAVRVDAVKGMALWDKDDEIVSL